MTNTVFELTKPVFEFTNIVFGMTDRVGKGPGFPPPLYAPVQPFLQCLNSFTNSPLQCGTRNFAVLFSHIYNLRGEYI